ncbi:MAG TPA: hypothetical protein VGL47_14545 [Amycolatopsis sp.]|uniref:Secreted protein n=1 Tax=Amycolatopsis nalaikhensis TaxID=715472 RepID=A0ABY8XF69_9PSEU|nr:hypothetical protein [Amycolatopsis sp. 2-2]WIV54264.1 hypothetical protein QP939_36135 [Amycolatopsis sp. 2-2]
MVRNWTRTAATAAAATTVALLGAAPANAADTGNHCVLDTETGARQCFPDLQEALAHTSMAKIAARADGEVVQGTFFDGPDYTGDSLTITGPELCKKDGWVNWQFDLGDDWKNKITSVQPWGDCWIWLYPEPGLSGDRDGPFKENTGNVGSYMDNRTQSIGFS